MIRILDFFRDWWICLKQPDPWLRRIDLRTQRQRRELLRQVKQDWKDFKREQKEEAKAAKERAEATFTPTATTDQN